MTPQKIRSLAHKEFTSFEFWVRWKYQLLPTDPRFLAMEPWEIQKEFEMHRYMQTMLKGDDNTTNYEADTDDFSSEVDSWSDDNVTDWKPLSEEEIIGE